MSLTSELESSTSWVNGFFKDNFARVVTFTRAEGPRIKALDTKVQTELTGQSLSRVGTAVDYAIRLGWGLQPLESSVISAGIVRMEMLGTRNTPEERSRWAEVVRRLLETTRDASEEGLARTAILLAHLDAGFRSGGMWSEAMIEMAGDLAEDGWNPSRLLDIAGQRETTEVMELTRLAREALRVDEGEAVLMGPTFEGSSYVGGADADVIVGGRLWDVKTTMNPRNGLPVTIRQLIGYTLLDWCDEYGIRGVGVYFSRQGERIDWELEDLVERTATESRSTLSGLRGAFREAAPAANPGRVSRD